MKIKSFIILAVLVILVVGVVLYIPKKSTILSEKEAVALLIDQYTQLEQYQNTNLPPSSIESKQTADGWNLGFIRRGSGLPGILDATCYFVDNNKNITSIGEYKQDNFKENAKEFIAIDVINIETCQPSSSIQDTNPTGPLPNTQPNKNTNLLPVKKDGLGLGELGIFESISIRSLSIEEDSRCPIDVTCIQAGTVRLKIQVISSSGTSTSIVKLGQEFTTEGVRITLVNVTPVKNSKINVLEKDYRFNFSVTK